MTDVTDNGLPTLDRVADGILPLLGKLEGLKQNRDTVFGIGPSIYLPTDQGSMHLISYHKDIAKTSTIQWRYEDQEGRFTSVTCHLTEAGLLFNEPSAIVRVWRGNEMFGLFDSEIFHGTNYHELQGAKEYPAVAYTWSRREGRSRGELTKMRFHPTPDASFIYVLDEATGKPRIEVKGEHEAFKDIEAVTSGADALGDIPVIRTINFAEKAEELYRLARVDEFVEGLRNAKTREDEIREIMTDHALREDETMPLIASRGIEKN